MDGFVQLQLLTPNELAEMLKISKPTIYRLVEKRSLPFCKIGGSLRFQVKEVVAYIEKCRIKSADEMYEYSKTGK
jgi:excisionase family DNA binding protein